MLMHVNRRATWPSFSSAPDRNASRFAREDHLGSHLMVVLGQRGRMHREQLRRVSPATVIAINGRFSTCLEIRLGSREETAILAAACRSPTTKWRKAWAAPRPIYPAAKHSPRSRSHDCGP